MKESRRFSLATAAADGRSEIVLEGQPTGHLIDGRQLEAQYELASGGRTLHLLLITHGTPYEEILQVYLTDGGGQVIEQTKLGGAYAPGILTNVRPVSDHELRFDFQGPCRLVLREQPKGIFRPRLLDLSKVNDREEPSR